MTVDIYLVRRRPQALQDLCFEMIAKNFKEVLSTSTEKSIDFLRRKSQLLLMKFQELEHFVCLEHASFCLNRHLKEINFSWFSNVDIPAIVNKLATVESTTFTVLTLQRFYDISADVLWPLVCSLPKTLESLSLQCENFTDSMLDIVTKRCPRLCELCLMGCFNISTEGVMALCSKNEAGDLCPNQILQKLNLRGTRVRENELVSIIRNFPNLTEIKHYFIRNVLYKIHSENRLNGSPRNCNLKSLQLEAIFIPHRRDLKSIALLCPYVTKLWIEVNNQTALKMCEKFTSLNDVHFRVDKPCDFSPFLEARGKTLNALTIGPLSFQDFACTSVSMRTIVKSCPKLEYLSLLGVRFTEVKYEPNLRCTLPRLTEVGICVKNVENLEDSLICLLSRSPNLEVFSLRNASSFHPAPKVFSFFKHISLSKLNALEMNGVDVKVSRLLGAMHNFELGE